MSAPAPKPFSLQSPEHIAMEYGGNKQKIAQAVQMGIIDSTSGLMAGMFIDRMRSAQAQEQAPQQTVAQKVLGPRPSQMPPQGGLGGLPPGGPQGAPPMQMASAAPPPGAPAPQGPVGMGAGGLTTLPLPDDMYDEQTFAGGGIVAFDGGGNTYDRQIAELEAEAAKSHSQYYKDQLQGRIGQLRRQARLGAQGNIDVSFSDQIKSLIPNYFLTPEQQQSYQTAQSSVMRQLAGIENKYPTGDTSTPPAAPAAVVPPPRPAAAPAAVVPPPVVPRPRAPAAPAKATTPDDDYGLPKAPEPFDQKKTFDDILAMMGPAPKATKASAEEKAKERNYDTGMAMLAAASAGLGKGSKTFLGALGDAGEGAMPVLAESAKARRADAKEERQAQYEQDRTEYAARGTAAAATRAEQNTMREYGLNLAQARAKIANDKAQLDISRQGAANTAGYYKYLTGKDDAEVERIAGILSKGKGISMADARVEAVNILHPGLTRGTQYTRKQADAQALAETKSPSFILPKGMTTQQWMNARSNEIMGGGSSTDPEIDDIVSQYAPNS